MQMNDISVEFLKTRDGSQTIYLKHLDETYHSINGAFSRISNTKKPAPGPPLSRTDYILTYCQFDQCLQKVTTLNMSLKINIVTGLTYWPLICMATLNYGGYLFKEIWMLSKIASMTLNQERLFLFLRNQIYKII
jgi:hypothetical protein